jgi:predicted outer membrane protein
VRLGSSRRPAAHAGGGRRWPYWLLASLLCAAATVPTVIAARHDDGGPAGADRAAGTVPANAVAGAMAGMDMRGVHLPQVAPTSPAPAGTGQNTGGQIPAGQYPTPDVTDDQNAGADGPLPNGWTMTRYGPLGPADRDLLVRVRWAGLWECPAGDMAQDRAASTRVKEVGATLSADHAKLDEQVRAVAAELDVPLPNEPNEDQQGWLKEMASKRGAAFDNVFTDRLRVAHGKVFATVSGVRAGTRNSLVRSFAQTGVEIVMKHMTLLESTGLVNYAGLPEPPEPPASPRSAFIDRRGPEIVAVWIILLVVVGVGARGVLGMLRR